MEEADRILINSLISIGLELPNDDISLEEFTPDILINATSLCLEYIFESKNEPQSFPKSCPANMASRYKVGQALTEGIKNLGFKDAIGYQSFLYLNVKDTRRILSFLVEILPKETGPSVVERLDDKSKLHSLIQSVFGDSWRFPWLPSYCHQVTDRSTINRACKCLLVPFGRDRTNQSFPSLDMQVDRDFSQLLIEVANYESRIRLLEQEINVEQLSVAINQINLKSMENSTKPEAKKRTKFVHKMAEEKREMPEKLEEKPVESEDAAQSEEVIAEAEFQELQTQFQEHVEHYNRLLDKLDDLNGKCNMLLEKETELDKELGDVRKDWGVRHKVGIVLEHGEGSIEKLQAANEKKQNQVENIERQWNAHKNDLVERIRLVQESRIGKNSESKALELQLEHVKQDMDECRQNYLEKDSEIRVLDEKVKQIIKADSNKQNRNEFTKRILELTENKKKQNQEIKKILAEIFLLQKEINSLRGKLDRSFIETSDIISEFSKKDEVAKKMYKVLLGIHENCSNLVEVIEEKGRLIREIRELETAIDNEDRENVEKNLNKIVSDYEEAKLNCSNLKKLLKDHKSYQID